MREEKILRFVQEKVIIHVTRNFDARQFEVNLAMDASVRIEIGPNFRRRFLQKVELSVSSVIHCYVIKETLQSANDMRLWQELGEGHIETQLGEIHYLLQLQPNGEAGLLLTDRKANIFYAKDAFGILWAVEVVWSGDGWRIEAHEPRSDRNWELGCQVFSVAIPQRF